MKGKNYFLFMKELRAQGFLTFYSLHCTSDNPVERQTHWNTEKKSHWQTLRNKDGQILYGNPTCMFSSGLSDTQQCVGQQIRDVMPGMLCHKTC